MLRALPDFEIWPSSTDLEAAWATERVSGGTPRRSSNLAGHGGHTSNGAAPRENIVLETEVERERAFAMLAFLCNAWVQAHRPDPQSTVVLPRVLAVPLFRLARRLGRRPILDYASSVLCNWGVEPPLLPDEAISLDRVRILRTFTGHPAERWFYAIHVVIEANGAAALAAMGKAQKITSRHLMMRRLDGEASHSLIMTREEAIERKSALQSVLRHIGRFTLDPVQEDYRGTQVQLSPVYSSSQTPPTTRTTGTGDVPAVTRCLLRVADALEHMNLTLARMSEGCSAAEFYNVIRPWLNGFPARGGVLFEGVPAEEAHDLRLPEAPDPAPGVPSAFTAASGDRSSHGPFAVLALSGASGAQSSLLPSIDAFLGVPYAASAVARTEAGKFVAQLQGYRHHMPPQHRALIANFEAGHTARHFISAVDEEQALQGDKLQQTDLAELVELKRAYNQSIEHLLSFRQKHVGFASMYIKRMAQRAGGSVPRGTGGSDFSVHLMRHVTDTRKCLYEIPEAS